MSDILESIKKSWKDIPNGARSFLKKAVLLFVLWKCIYLLTVNKRLFDKPLTNLFASHTAFTLNFMLAPAENPYHITNNHKSVLVTFNNQSVLYIGDGCNALELFVLYLGFIVCMPASLKRKFIWCIFGIITIHLINIARGCGLIYLYQYHQSHFEFAHKYLFKISVYAVVFILWMFYSRKLKFENAQ